MSDLVAAGCEAFQSRTVLPPTVPAEDELLEVDIEVTTVDTVVDTHHPALHQREDAAYALEPERRGQFAHGLRGALTVGNTTVSLVAVGEDRRVGIRAAQHEGMQGFPAAGADRFKADAARPNFLAPLYRPDDVEHSDGAAALSAADVLVLGSEGNARLVDLDGLFVAAQFLAVGIDHGPTQFVQQEAGGLVGAGAQLSSELEDRDAVGVRRHEVRSQEPLPQREVCPVHNCASDYARLFMARAQFAVLVGLLPNPLSGQRLSEPFVDPQCGQTSLQAIASGPIRPRKRSR